MDVKFFDSLFEGDSANGVKLCKGLTGGDFWAQIAGCQIIYRGQNVEDADFENILAVTLVGNTQISLPDFLEHLNSSLYFYVLRRANLCGDEERTSFASAKMLLDENGDLAGPYCNCIFDSIAEQIEEEKIKLTWSYRPISQQAQISEFLIYYDGGSGTIDYENPLAQIEHSGPGFYSYEVGSLSGDSYLFCIKATTSDGLERIGNKEIKVQIDSGNVGGASILQVQTL